MYKNGMRKREFKCTNCQFEESVIIDYNPESGSGSTIRSRGFQSQTRYDQKNGNVKQVF